MNKRSILKPNKAYTFSDYFELSNPTNEIVEEFGYQYAFQKLPLPHSPIDDNAFASLREIFYRKLPHISLTSEAAKKNFLISPLLFELLDHINFNIDMEYPIYVNDKLKGSLDYVLRSSQNLVVLEAKKADLERGFSQLAVELIAMDHYVEDDAKLLYGTITVGDVWRFGVLDRERKLVIKDIDAFVVPANLEALFSILIGILGAKQRR